MPVSKKKRTTPENALSTSEPSSPLLPEQQAFHQHLRALAQSAVRTVLEVVMREELDAFIGAAWGECSPKRNGYRNGTYTRDLATATGRLEDLKVPRDRAGQFHTQAFELLSVSVHKLPASHLHISLLTAYLYTTFVMASSSASIKNACCMGES